MIKLVKDLPEGVDISQHLRDKAASRKEGPRKWRYLMIQLYGRSMYVPITRNVWEAFGLKKLLEGKHVTNDGDVSLDAPVGEAIRDIAGALQLQLRDNILDDMERMVLQEVHDRIDQALHKPLRLAMEKEADGRMRLLSPEEKPATQEKP